MDKLHLRAKKMTRDETNGMLAVAKQMSYNLEQVLSTIFNDGVLSENADRDLKEAKLACLAVYRIIEDARAWNLSHSNKS